MRRNSSPDPAATPAPNLWTMLERRRNADYQPPPDQLGTRDENGCADKLARLRSAGLHLCGCRMLSLGASTAYYEAALGADAARCAECDDATRGVAMLHLVDTSEHSLAVARERLAAVDVSDVRFTLSAAHAVPFDTEYDVCLFLSLFHHYDRLGGIFREMGLRLLGDIGTHCRVLIFETGQSDDRQCNAGDWATRLEMADWPSPRAWIETRIPEITGYDAWRHLGVSDRTHRHLYAFWRRFDHSDSCVRFEPRAQ